MADEAAARENIDAQLQNAGWKELHKTNQEDTGYKTEVETGTGPCDYLLQHEGQPIGVVEAKTEGGSLLGALDQETRYARGHGARTDTGLF